MSVIPPDVWRAAAIGDLVAPIVDRAEQYLRDYITTGNPADRTAAVWEGERAVQLANRAAAEWSTSPRRRTR